MLDDGEIIFRLERTLLETGMMNQTFIDMIKNNEVDDDHIVEALKNFKRAMHPGPAKVKDRYVLGFVFSLDASRVLLIWKNRPEWQKGKLNGIGGKIEEGELPIDAMKREFSEETSFAGLTKPGSQELLMPYWHLAGKRGREAQYDGQDGSYEMFVYAAFFDDVRYMVRDTFFAYPDVDNETSWISWPVPDPNREEVIALPLNREILARKGVPGLAWTVDAALQALRENFVFDVKDPMRMEDRP